jgi:hypothetical protein
LRIEPQNIVLQVGERSPPITVIVEGPAGPTAVAATLQSLDAAVVAPEDPFRGRFVARGEGQTQIQAEFHGATATANVTVSSGPCFQTVRMEDDPAKNAFRVVFDIMTPASSGPLEYRAYKAGTTAPDRWVADQPQGERRRAQFSTDWLPYGAPDSVYRIVAEVRDESGKIQRYPISFEAKRKVHFEIFGQPDQPPVLGTPF